MDGEIEAPAFVYDLPRLLWLRQMEAQLAVAAAPALHLLKPLPAGTHGVGALAGSFNPLTRGHEALVAAALDEGLDGLLLLLPLRAVDKEAVSRAALVDRALVLLEWAAQRERVGVGLVNRGLYVDMAALLAAQYPAGENVFVVGHDKIVQIFDPRYYADRDVALGRLFSLAGFRVAPRLGAGEASLHALLGRPENAPFAQRVTPLRVPPDVDALSSTAVREAAQAGRPLEDLVPPEAAAFLRAAQPYTPPLRLPDGEIVDPYGLRLALLDAAARGRLMPDADFATLCRAARSTTLQGRHLRAWLNA